MKTTLQMLSGAIRAVAVAIVFGGTVWAQIADGNLAGVILDASGAAVVNAAVAAENLATGLKASTATDEIGAYRLNNLPVGNYRLSASASGFQTTALASVAVELSKTTTAHITLTVGQQSETITVTDTPSLIDTTTAQIANLYTTRMASDLAVATNSTQGYLNLSLLGAGVASSGGVGAGTGPSVGGQRPRNNNFTVEGSDNNRKDITGPVLTIPNDAIREFTVLQNQFSAEYGHSAGGQFNAVIQSGTNQWHGKFYEYFQNRHLNAQDELYKRAGNLERARYDANILGANFGGPIRRDKAFFFTNFDYTPVGRNSSTPTSRWAPTEAGYEMLARMPQLSQTNLSVLRQYLGAATVQDGNFTVPVQGAAIPAGILPQLAPSYSNTYRGLGAIDYNISSKDQLRGRFVSNRIVQTDIGSQTPQFWGTRPTNSYLASISEFHTFGPALMNEVRAAYNRYNDYRPVPDIRFPGMNVFPNISLNELGVIVGPFLDAPSATTQNVYQLADNLTWNAGRHDIKFGFEGRSYISSMDFISKVRGDYRYSGLNSYLMDLTPDNQAQRAVGSTPYLGNAPAYYAYANDNWRVTRKLTVNLGVRWEYNGISKGMKEQARNSIADVPGVITFREPKAQMANFAPRIGFAYSPGKNGTTSIRGGFGIAYDQIFDNIGNNVRPPQTTSFVTVLPNGASGFLASGGIPTTALPSSLTPQQARANTIGWIPDQKLGYAASWNFGIQHSFAKDYVVDIRYLGTRGVHLLLQSTLNRVALVTPERSLPLYYARPSTAELDSLPLTLTQLRAGQNNPWAQYGFTNSNGVTAYTPQGNSIYHGLAIDVTKRLSGQFMFKTGYTWSHLRDDSTADVNSTALSPRRPQDFGNLRSEWASSALDRRHRLTVTALWDTPWFRGGNRFLHNVLGGYTFSGIYTAESPQWVTPQSVADANLNGDNVSDRVVVNPNGVKGTGSDVSVLSNSAGQTVAYLATNPNAEFIRAQAGMWANGGRNILPTNGINNFDLSASKSFSVRERARLEIRADFYNALNKAQYLPGRANNVAATNRMNETAYLNPANPNFGRWDRVFMSNSRYLQLAAKFTF